MIHIVLNKQADIVRLPTICPCGLALAFECWSGAPLRNRKQDYGGGGGEIHKVAILRLETTEIY